MAYRTNKPRRPEGNSAQAIFMQAVWDQLWGGGLNFIDSPTVKFSRTSRGIVARGKRSAGGAATTTERGMRFRGIYSSTYPVPDGKGVYNAQDVVFFTPSGGQSGAYIGLQDDIPEGNTPDTLAPYWAKWPYPPPGIWG